MRICTYVDCGTPLTASDWSKSRRRCEEHREYRGTHLTRPEHCEAPGCRSSKSLRRRRWPTPESRTWLCGAHSTRLVYGSNMLAPPGGSARERMERPCRWPGCTAQTRTDRARRCEEHAGTRMPLRDVVCSWPGCEQQVRRTKASTYLRRCEEHTGRPHPGAGRVDRGWHREGSGVGVNAPSASTTDGQQTGGYGAQNPRVPAPSLGGLPTLTAQDHLLRAARWSFTQGPDACSYLLSMTLAAQGIARRRKPGRRAA